MQIKNSMWVNSNICFIHGYNEITKQDLYFIGTPDPTTGGFDEETDRRYIIDWGQKFTEDEFRMFVHFLSNNL